jgi:DNA-binding transcriptional ArsR family regulator/rhodanese-related sulfurtransferase
MQTDAAFDPKQPLFDQFSIVARAFAHGHRLALLEVLAQARRDVNSLSSYTGLSIANTSQHLKVLRAAGLVSSHRAGKHVLYSLADDTVVDLVRSLRAFAERHSDAARRTVKDNWPQMDRYPEVSREQVSQWVEAGSVVLLDTRPLEEFAAGHIPGAHHVPKGTLDIIDPLIEAEAPIVAYCRGAYCATLHDTLEYLGDRDIAAHRLEDGFAEWRASGYPVKAEEFS